jgi:hypothetical protein
MKGDYTMIPPVTPITSENYNETVLVPLLHEKVNDLTAQVIVLEAKLRIANKEKAEMEKKIAAMSAAASTPAPAVGTALEAEVDG